MNIEIYGKPDCPQCVIAKNYLDARNIPYTYRELGTDFVREDIQRIAPTARTFPVIFVNGRDAGGFAGLSSRLMMEDAFPSNKPQLLAE